MSVGTLHLILVWATTKGQEVRTAWRLNPNAVVNIDDVTQLAVTAKRMSASTLISAQLVASLLHPIDLQQKESRADAEDMTFEYYQFDGERAAILVPEPMENTISKRTNFPNGNDPRVTAFQQTAQRLLCGEDGQPVSGWCAW